MGIKKILPWYLPHTTAPKEVSSIAVMYEQTGKKRKGEQGDRLVGHILQVGIQLVSGMLALGPSSSREKTSN